MKYVVTVIRTGAIFIEADSESEAMDIANHRLTDDVSWSDDWEATDAEEDDTLPDNMYFNDKAF